MIKVFQIDEGLAIIKWENLEDATLLAKLIQQNDIEIKSLHKELRME